MKPLTTCIWFENQAEEAANYYTSVIKNSEIKSVFRNPEPAPGETGTVLTVSFTVNGSDFLALNGGNYYQLNPAISFVLHCKNQDEIDYYWNTFLDGGAEMQCGWVTDKFGVSWQIVPEIFDELAGSPQNGNVNKMFEALLEMKKLDIQKLIEAYNTK